MTGYPERLSALVDEHLAALRFGSRVPTTAGLEQAMRYSLLAGGKRVRPSLALATAEAIGIDPSDVLPLGVAIELIHTYSLIHDDLPAMDDDDLRRGRPTCHVRYGEDVAILAGDALYAEAFSYLLRRQRPLVGGPSGLLAGAGELADATGVDGMVGGQYLDVAEQIDGSGALRMLHALKTGRLIAASVLCPLLLCGIDGAALEPWRAYAAELGVLFQIVDDILDVTGSEQQTGKSAGSDERHGKRTYVSEYGLDGARERADSSHAFCRSTLSRCAPAGAVALEAITDFIFTRSS